MTTHLIPLLEQNLIVLAQRSAKDNRRHALKAVYPLLSLGSLPAHVEHVYSASINRRHRVSEVRQLGPRKTLLTIVDPG